MQGEALAEPVKEDGVIDRPKDGTAFEITDRDVVRFTGPAAGGTGYTTTVTVTRGDATVSRRSTYTVVMGKAVRTGGVALEFDVRPVAGKTGVVKVAVTTTPPTGQAETKDFEFVVK